MLSPAGKQMLGMVVFDGFELLDTFGPLEMFGFLPNKVDIVRGFVHHEIQRNGNGIVDL